MKLCVSSTGKDIASLVDTSFGRAPYFLIIDTENDNIEVMKNSAATTGQGAGIAAAQAVTDKKVDAVLTGYTGPNAYNALHAAGIKVFEGVSGHDTVVEVIDRFHSKAYMETTSPKAKPGCGRGSGRGMGRGRGGGQCRRR
jgi:predicted Fe-Mo cluster-binding NifX family protein